MVGNMEQGTESAERGERCAAWFSVSALPVVNPCPPVTLSQRQIDALAARIRFSAGFRHQLEVGDALADGNLKLMRKDDGRENFPGAKPPRGFGEHVFIAGE